MICPKCGRPVDENAVICRGCDFILDTDFLGDGILDEEHSLRPGAGGVDEVAFNLLDAVILGNIDDESQSFETSDSGFHLKANLSARLYVSGRSQALMSPDAVPALSPEMSQGIEGLRLTPFEKHVLAFIDGRRPVEMIRKAAGLDEAEVKTALATLADKGVVKVVGRALSDMDFDAETMPKSPFKRARMRGSIVGAVALVGDEADRAIEDAFRTQVSLSPLKQKKPAADDDDGPGDTLGRGVEAHGAAADGDDEEGAPTGGQRRLAALANSVPSDADAFSQLKPTDEVSSAAAALRGALPRMAVNQGNRPVGPGKPAAKAGPLVSAEAAARPVTGRKVRSGSAGSLESAEASLLEASDGFDDFSEPSEIASVMKQEDPSESSLPPRKAAGARVDKRGASVFADLSASGTPLAGLDELADSRVQLRPIQAPQRPARAGAARVVAQNGGADSPSVEAERQAASGEVWDDAPAAGPLPKVPGAERKQKTTSTSLSDLLSDPNDEEHTANISPELAAALVPGSSSGSGSFEEPTAAGQPMPPLPLPNLVRPTDEFRDETGRLRLRKAPSAMASVPEEEAVGRADQRLDEHSGLHAPRLGRGAADDLFGESNADASAAEGDDAADSLMDRTGLRPAQPSVSGESSIDASEEQDPVPVPARPPRAAQARAAAMADAAGASDDVASDDRPSSNLPSSNLPSSNLPSSNLPSNDLPSSNPRDDEASEFEGSDAFEELDAADAFEEADAPSDEAANDRSMDASHQAGADPSEGFGESSGAFASRAGTGNTAGNVDSENPTGDVPRRPRPMAPDAPLLSTHANSVISDQATVSPSQADDEPPRAAPRGGVVHRKIDEAARAFSSERSADQSADRSVDRSEPPSGAADASQERSEEDHPRTGSSSGELLDSALLIRPAAKAVPLAGALAAARGSRPRDRVVADAKPTPPPPPAKGRARPPPRSEVELEQELEDELSKDVDESNEDTVNLEKDDPRLRRKPGGVHADVGVGKNGGGAAAIPSDFSQVVARAERSDPARERPTEENRRRGEKLFEEALKERAAGRTGAARMNAKLASIYDPSNDDYRAALEDWDEAAPAAAPRPKGPPPPTAANAPIQSSQAPNSEESQMELRAMYDEAQDFENAGDFDEALAALQRGVHRFPNAAAFHNRIGVLLAMKKRNFDGAIAAIQRAIDLDPDNLHYRNNLGKVMQRVRARP